MNQELLKLKPARLWHYFVEILDIPRPSNKEEKIIQYLKKFGETHDLETLQDKIGNILIRKPATKGKESVQSVVLQSHIDMVCEKNNDKVHDFNNDPIETYIANEWVKAKGTTLGADDGIGVAAQLAILEANNIVHGPIECLFTINEELGLTGAQELDPDLLKSRILLNLDSEDEGQIFIGCAGGLDTSIELPFSKKEMPKGIISLKVEAKGLLGGHSGDEIQKGLGNANKILTRFLWEATKSFNLNLSHFDGGNLRNAIAREAHAIITIPAKDKNGFIEAGNQYREILLAEFKITDPDVTFLISDTENPGFVCDSDTQHNLLNSLYACPHGVFAYSAEIPDFVETSTNLAAVKTMDGFFKITTSQRSSVESAKQDIANMVNSVFTLAGAKVKHSNAYPGWQPNPNSEIVAKTVKSYKKLFNTKPEVLAIHAGLECGLIGDKYEEMDMISFGPTIKGAHSPNERLHITSTQKFWDLLIEILNSIN
jgi:dipeptidase D